MSLSPVTQPAPPPPPAPTVAPSAPLAPPLAFPAPGVPPAMGADAWHPSTSLAQLPAPQGPSKGAQRGDWGDLVAPIANAAMGLPLAGAGALIGTLLGGPVAGAWAAAVGGSLVGVLVAGQEVWGGTRPGTTIPVRWKLVGLALAPVGLNAVGAGIGFAVAGTASAVLVGTLVAAAVPFALLWGTVLANRWRDRNLPAPADPIPAPAQP